MPQMSPILWELLSVVVVILLMLVIFKLFFLISYKDSMSKITSEEDLPSSINGKALMINWSW